MQLPARARAVQLFDDLSTGRHAPGDSAAVEVQELLDVVGDGKTYWLDLSARSLGGTSQ